MWLSKEKNLEFISICSQGEPLVRKADLIRLCEKHSDCAFLSFTNGTLVDEDFCAELKRVGNLYLAISLEGFSEVNDLRRGNGVFGKVMNAMDLLKKNGLVFGTSICYTSKNYEAVTSEEFVDLMIEKGRRYAMYFHINANGDAEPCVFIHYSGANIRTHSLLEILRQPLFMAYHDNQPFNENLLRPCPMLENPEILQKMVKETGAKFI